MVCTLRLDLALILASFRLSLVTPMVVLLEVQIYKFLLEFQIVSKSLAIHIKKLHRFHLIIYPNTRTGSREVT